MTDTSSTIAGHYKHHGPIMSCILNEGAPTVVASGTTLDMQNVTMKTLTWASPLARGNMVQLTISTDCTFLLTGGSMVVEQATDGDAAVIGRIVSTPGVFTEPANDAAANDLDERLAGGYYRTALVEIYGGVTAILKAEVTLDGTNDVVIGSTDNVVHNLTSDYADDDTTEIKLYAVASGGTGTIAFHSIASGSAGDRVTCLVGITGMLVSATGA